MPVHDAARVIHRDEFSVREMLHEREERWRANVRIDCLIAVLSSTKPPGSICSRKKLQSSANPPKRASRLTPTAGDFLRNLW